MTSVQQISVKYLENKCKKCPPFARTHAADVVHFPTGQCMAHHAHETIGGVLTTLDNLEISEFVNSGKLGENSGNLKLTQGIYQMLFFSCA